MGSPYSSSHEDGTASGAELVQGLLSVPLGAVAVDTGAGVALAVQEVLQGVGALLGLHEHQGQGFLACKEKERRERETRGAPGGPAVEGPLDGGRGVMGAGTGKLYYKEPLKKNKESKKGHQIKKKMETGSHDKKLCINRQPLTLSLNLAPNTNSGAIALPTLTGFPIPQATVVVIKGSLPLIVLRMKACYKKDGRRVWRHNSRSTVV